MNLLDLGTQITNLPDRIRQAATTAASNFGQALRNQIKLSGPTLPPTVRKPIYRITVEGDDITADMKDRLIELSLTDNPGFEADQLDITLDDSDGLLDLPPRGAVLSVQIGFEDSGLVDKGTFTVDEVSHSGPPDRMIIRARSVDMRGGLTTQRERSWHKTTVGDMVAKIAEEVGLTPAVAEKLRGQYIEHIDQTNESAANLLQRVAAMFDAFATVKAGRLLFGHLGAGITVGGKPISRLVIQRRDGDSHTFSIADRETFTHVKATWNDTERADKGEVIWGQEEDDAENNKPATPAPTEEKQRRYKNIDPVQKSRSKAHRLAVKQWGKVSAADRQKYDAVSVPYKDSTLQVEGVVLYGKEDEEAKRSRAKKRADKDKARAEEPAPTVELDRNGAENIKTLRHVYANRTNAIRGARTEWRRLKRAMANFEYTLAEGLPQLYPEVPVTVRGFKPSIDGTDWYVRKVTHTLSDAGLISRVTLEMRATEIPD